MSDLIADLRQKLADWGDNAELRLAIERDEWGVTTHFVSRVDAFGDDEPAWDRADTLDPLIVAAVNALPGLLDELEAARALIDNRQGLNSLDIVDVVAAYDQARANG